jgi:hypothetical protein
MVFGRIRRRVRVLRKLGLLVPLGHEQYLDSASLFSAAFPPLFFALLDENGESKNPLTRYVAALGDAAYAVRAFLMNACIPVPLDCTRYNFEDEARAALDWLRQLREKDAAAALILADMALVYTFDVELALEILENLIEEEKERLKCIRQRIVRSRVILADALWELTTS